MSSTKAIGDEPDVVRLLLPLTLSRGRCTMLAMPTGTASRSVVEQPLTRALGNAFNWDGLMKLAGKHAVRFLPPCFCVHGDDPLHTSVWERLSLPEIIWLAKPKANIRRVHYQSGANGIHRVTVLVKD